MKALLSPKMPVYLAVRPRREDPSMYKFLQQFINTANITHFTYDLKNNLMGVID
jgi:hypothetical protein